MPTPPAKDARFTYTFQVLVAVADVRIIFGLVKRCFDGYYGYWGGLGRINGCRSQENVDHPSALSLKLKCCSSFPLHVPEEIPPNPKALTLHCSFHLILCSATWKYRCYAVEKAPKACTPQKMIPKTVRPAPTLYKLHNGKQNGTCYLGFMAWGDYPN